jgi:hypothetical protein
MLKRGRRYRGGRVGGVLGAVCAVALMGPGVALGSGQTSAATEGQQLSGKVASGCPTTAPSVTISWGDGASSIGTVDSSGDVSGSHTYAEEGSYSGQVTGCVHTSTFTVDVADAPLSATPGATVNGTPGQSFTAPLVGFKDQNPGAPGSDFSATVTWGDGSQSAGTVSAGGSGFLVTASHTYAAAGSFAAAVTVTDRGGSQARAQTTVDVAASHAHATFTAPAGSLPAGQQLVLDASASRSSGATIRSFDWTMDGKQVAVCDGSTSQLSTRFSAPGSYTFALTVTDGSGTRTAAAHTVVVNPPSHAGAVIARALRPGGIKVINTEQVFTCGRAASDPVVRLVPADLLPSPGPGCQTQVFAGVVEAVGCLTEHYEHVTITPSHSVINGKTETTYTLDTDPGQMPDIPKAEAQALLLRISRYYDVTCAQLGQCPTVDGFQQYEPQGQQGNGGGPQPLGQAHDVPTGSGGPAQTHVPTEIITPCSEKVSQSPVPTTACLDLYLSDQPVDFNGVEYVPHGGVILFAPQFNLVIASNAETDVADLQTEPAGAVDYQFPSAPQDPSNGQQGTDFPDLPDLIKSEPDASARAVAQQEFGPVGGFSVDLGSSLHISFQNGVTTINFQVDLPQPFSDGNGHRATATVYATISDTQGFQVHYAYLGGQNGQGGVSVALGPVQLSSFGICYRHTYDPNASNDPCGGVTGIDDSQYPDDTWLASGVLNIANKVEVDFRPGTGSVPGCSQAIPLGFAFSGGGLSQAGAAVNLMGLGGIDLFPPIPKLVTLTGLAAGFEQNPNYLKFGGCLAFNVVKVLTITANLFGVETNKGYQYKFTGNELGPGVLQQAGGVFPVTNHLAIGGSGVLSLSLPNLPSFQLANAYGLYVDDPPAVFFGAGFCFALPSGDCHNPPNAGIAINGGLNGAIGLSNGTPFDIEGHVGVFAQVGIGGIFETQVFGGQVDAIVSYSPTQPSGIAVCGTAKVWGNLSASAFVGYHWGESLSDVLLHEVDVDLTGDACANDWQSSFSVNVQQAHDAAATASVVRVPRGAKALDLYVRSSSGAPDITVAGPGGARATTAGARPDTAIRTGGLFLERIPALHETVVIPVHARPGVYRIAADPGSPAITGITRNEAFSPSIRARVAGRGLHRQLVYRIRQEPGQVVRFYELSGQVHRALGTSHGASGSIPFMAYPGRERRQIIAQSFIDGVPDSRTVVSSYQPPSVQNLSRVGHLRVRRRGASALVTFSRVAGATAYSVSAVLSDGTRVSFMTAGTRVTIAHLFYDVGGAVTVRALGDGVLTADGGRVTVRFKPAVHPPRLRRF